MSIIILLMLASLAVALVFVAAFVWAVKTSQFDDTYTPSIRVISDESKSKNKIFDKN